MSWHLRLLVYCVTPIRLPLPHNKKTFPNLNPERPCFPTRKHLHRASRYFEKTKNRQELNLPCDWTILNWRIPLMRITQAVRATPPGAKLHRFGCFQSKTDTILCLLLYLLYSVLVSFFNRANSKFGVGVVWLEIDWRLWRHPEKIRWLRLLSIWKWASIWESQFACRTKRNYTFWLKIL